VQSLGCDFLACSAYKFFGPHLGVLHGRRELLESLRTDKVRPAADTGAEKWQTGTANFEGIAGALAALDYLGSLAGEPGLPRAAALYRVFDRIRAHEDALAQRLIDGLTKLRGVRIVGLPSTQIEDRCATVSFTLAGTSPQALARELAANGVHCWAGNSYALALSQALALEPDGVLRLGLLHYNTAAEVDRVLGLVQDICRHTLA
jgi:selenocysteine lyase/cysteine desulfurase